MNMLKKFCKNVWREIWHPIEDTFKLNDRGVITMEDLRPRINVKSNGDVLKRAISLLDYTEKKIDQGYHLILKKGEHTITLNIKEYENIQS